MPPPHSADTQSQGPSLRISTSFSGYRPEPSPPFPPLHPQMQQVSDHQLSLQHARPSFPFGGSLAPPSNSTAAAAPPPHPSDLPYPGNGRDSRLDPTSQRDGDSSVSLISSVHVPTDVPHTGIHGPYESSPHHHTPLEGQARLLHYPERSEQKQWPWRQPGPVSDCGSFIGRDGRAPSAEWLSEPDQSVRIHGPAQQIATTGAQRTIPRLLVSNVPPRKRKRLTLACDTCRKRKIRCDGKSPCGPCVTYESDCSYNHTIRKRGPRASMKSETLSPGGTSQPDSERKFVASSGSSHIPHDGHGSRGNAVPAGATQPMSAHQHFSASHQASGQYPPHLPPQASPSIRSLSPGIVGSADNDGNGVRHTTSSFVLHPRHDDRPPPQFLELLSTVRTAVQLFSTFAISGLAPDSLRKWCASQPFDSPAWQQQPTHAVPHHVDPHLQQSMSFALGLAIAVFVYRTCGPEALLSSQTTHSPAGQTTNNSLAPSSPTLRTDDVHVADWMSKSVGIAMQASCVAEPELGLGDCQFARGLVMYLLAYSELTVGNALSARRMCLAALDALQEGTSVGSPTGPTLPPAAVFQQCEVNLSVSALYHTLSLATHVPGGRSSELVIESERTLSGPAVVATSQAGGFGSDVVLPAHFELLSLIVRAVNMSSAPRDRVPLGDRLFLLDTLQAALATLEAKDPFPPDDPARFAPALYLRVQSYAILIQLARPAILEALGVKPDGTQLPSPVAAQNTPTLDAGLAHATVRLVQLSRWIANQAIDSNNFLQHSLAAAAHAIAPAILQATSGVAMMIANSRRGQEYAHVHHETREAEMQHHRSAAHSLLKILQMLSLVLPSPVSIVHQMIMCVSHFCETLDTSTNPDVVPFVVRVERDLSFGSPFPPVSSWAAIHSMAPAHPGEASRAPALPPPILHHHDPSRSPQAHHHPPHMHSHSAHASWHTQFSSYPRLQTTLAPIAQTKTLSTHSDPASTRLDQRVRSVSPAGPMSTTASVTLPQVHTTQTAGLA